MTRPTAAIIDLLCSMIAVPAVIVVCFIEAPPLARWFVGGTFLFGAMAGFVAGVCYGGW